MKTSSFKTEARKVWKRAKTEGYELVDGDSEAEVIDLLAQKLAAEARLKLLIVVNKEKQQRAFQRHINKAFKVTVQRHNGREQETMVARRAIEADDDVPF